MKRLLATKKVNTIAFYLIIATWFGMFTCLANATVHPNTFAIVTNQFSDGATVIDLTVDPHEATPVTPLDIGIGIGQPNGVAVTPDGTTALVTSVSDGIVSVIDLTEDPAQEIYRVEVSGYPHGIAITPDGTRAVVGNSGNYIVSILDLTSNPPIVIKTITVGGSYKPYAVGITPDGQYAIIGGSNAYVLNLTNYEVEYSIDIARFPIGMTVDPTGNTAVITTIGEYYYTGKDIVSILDLTTTPFSLKANVTVGRNPGSVPDISPDGKYAVVANADSDDVSIIDLTLNPPAVVATISVGENPRGVGIIDDDNIALVANRSSHSITKIDLNKLEFMETFPGISSPSRIAVFKKITNQKPVAQAGGDQTVNEGDSVNLDGSVSSDPENDPLTYSWLQVGGTTVSLDMSDPVFPSFSAPWVAVGGETLTFELIVSDEDLDSDPDYVNITVKNVNNAPIADAGDYQAVKEGSGVTLDGSESYDLDGESITYSWLQTAGSPVTLSDTSAVKPSFTAPDVTAGETLTFELTVDDGIDTSTDTIDVFVENVNHQPTADVGLDQTVDEGTSVAMDGSASSDPDNDPLTFVWTQIGGSTVVTLSDPAAASPTFTAPSGADTLRFQLIVNDGELSSDPDVLIITVLASNDPSACGLAQASPDRFWPPNHKMVPVEIVGVTDPDNDQVTITVTGVTQDEPVNNTGDGDTSPDAVIQGDTVLLRAERAGDGNGRVYQVTFTADDGNNGICTGNVTVCVPHDRKDTGCIDDGQYYDSQ
jgi:YVTN family beta-propeller protein